MGVGIERQEGVPPEFLFMILIKYREILMMLFFGFVFPLPPPSGNIFADALDRILIL